MDILLIAGLWLGASVWDNVATQISRFGAMPAVSPAAQVVDQSGGSLGGCYWSADHALRSALGGFCAARTAREP